MAKVDDIYKEMLSDIITKGTDTTGEKVRPHWEDGATAYTIKRFGVVNRYDLREEFPLLTLRKVPFKSTVDEILWIYQKKSNNVKELNSHIWDQWADEQGSIGAAYGYQIGKQFAYEEGVYDCVEENIPEVSKLYSEETAKKFIEECLVRKVRDPLMKYPCSMKIHRYTDQMDSVLTSLKNTPFSRRIITNMYNHDDLIEMHLHPCAYSCTFNVTDEGYDKLVLNMILNQRSLDTIVAGGWNVAQYAALLMMIAQVSDMIPGEFVHAIADAHIYDRHMDIAKELISRKGYSAAKITLDPDVKNFYDFTVDSFSISGYEHGDSVGKLPVAL